jgi:hypothetical protein
LPLVVYSIYLQLAIAESLELAEGPGRQVFYSITVSSIDHQHAYAIYFFIKLVTHLSLQRSIQAVISQQSFFSDKAQPVLL